MAIGRISGPLLKENLLRDEVNLAFETNLLYLDVNTHADDVSLNPGDPSLWTGRVGIRNSNPAYPLDVTGTFRATTILGGELDIDEVLINNNSISSQIGDLVISAATASDKVTFNSDVLINGNLHATGSITADGSLQLGNEDTDNVVFAADINSNFMPNVTDTFNLGGTDKRWRRITVQSAEIGDVFVENNEISTSLSNGNLILSGNGSGSVVISGPSAFNDATINGSFTVNGFTDLNGSVDISQTLTVGQILNVGSVINTDNIRISGNRIETTESNSNLELVTNGSGYIDLRENTVVTGTLTVSNTVSAPDATIPLINSSQINADQANIGDIEIDTNVIKTTRSNADLELDASGTGTIELLTDTNVSGTLTATDVYGNIFTNLIDSADSSAIAFTPAVVFNSDVTVDNRLTTNDLTVTGDFVIDASGTVNVSGNQITNLGAPVADSDAATKAYVDEVALGLQTKPAVRAATTANLSAVYADGPDSNNPGVGATLTADTLRDFDILDGVNGNWTVGMAVLVKNQTNAEENGRYVLTTVGQDGVTAWVLTRCYLCDEPSEIPGAYIFVQEGTVNKGTGWVQTVADPSAFVVGVDDIIVTQFSGPGTYVAGTGLTLNITEFSVNANQPQIVEVGTLIGLDVNGNSLITGNLEVTGDITIGGNIRIGDQDVDTITVAADFTSDLVPDVSNTYDLGAPAKEWRGVYASKFTNGNIVIDDNFIKTTVSNSDLELQASGVGTIELQSDANVTGNFGVSVQATLASANVQDLTAGRVVLAGVNGELEDSTNLTFDGNELIITGDITVTNDVDINNDLTVGGNVAISGDTTHSGNVTVDKNLTVTGDVFAGPINTDDIRIAGNRIETTQSNSNLELDTVGSGAIELLTDARVTGTFEVTGNSVFGTTDTDTIDIKAEFVSDLVPDVTDTYDLGTAAKRWNQLHAVTADIGDVAISGTTIESTALNSDLYINANGSGNVVISNLLSLGGGGSLSFSGDTVNFNNILIDGDGDYSVIRTLDSNTNLYLDAAGTGTINLTSDTNIVGNLDVTGDITLGGNIRIGDQNVDTVTVIADFTSDLIPDASNTYDLGSAAKQWRVIHASEFDNGVVNINDNVITTTVSNADLELRASGTGVILIPNNDVTVSNDFTVNGTATFVDVNATGDLTVTQTLTVNGVTQLNNDLTLVGDLTQTGNYTLTGSLSAIEGLTASNLQTADIRIDGNVITTTLSNSDLELRASGAGTIELQTNTTVTGNLVVSGDVTAVTATFTEVNADILNVDGVTINDNVISTNASNANLELTPSGTGIVYINGTGAVRIPSGTTAERPVSGEFGMIRYNGQTNTIEAWNGAVFSSVGGGSLTDNDADTFATVETAGNDEDTFRFFIGNNSSLSPVSKQVFTIERNTVTVDAVFVVTGTVSAPDATIPLINASEINVDQINVGSIEIDTNVIKTVDSNANLELDASGTGTIELLTDTAVTGNLAVTGTVTASDATIPLINANEINVDQINVGSIEIDTNVIKTVDSNANLELDASGTGTIELLTDTGITGSLTVQNSMTVSNKIRISDNVIENINTNEDLIIRASGTGRVVIDGAGGEAGNVFATDPLLTLNAAQTSTNTYDMGLILERGTDINVGFIWDESAEEFAAISTIEQGTVRGNVSITDYQNISTASIKLNSEIASKVTFTDVNKVVRSLDSGRRAEVDGVMKFTTSAQAAIPTGTLAQRPSAPEEGTIRFNTTDKIFEGYADGAWRAMGFGSGTAPSYQGIVADGIDFEFVLDQTPLSSAGIIVAINGVVQEPEIAYTVDGNVLRFIDETSTVIAPDSGDRIDVRFLSMPAVNTMHTINLTGDGTTATFDIGYTIPNEESIIVFVNSIYQDTPVYSVSGSTVTFDNEIPLDGDRINVVIFPSIVAPDLPTKTYVDNKIADDAIAYAIALG